MSEHLEVTPLQKSSCRRCESFLRNPECLHIYCRACCACFSTSEYIPQSCDFCETNRKNWTYEFSQDYYTWKDVLHRHQRNTKNWSYGSAFKKFFAAVVKPSKSLTSYKKTQKTTDTTVVETEDSAKSGTTASNHSRHSTSSRASVVEHTPAGHPHDDVIHDVRSGATSSGHSDNNTKSRESDHSSRHCGSSSGFPQGWETMMKTLQSVVSRLDKIESNQSSSSTTMISFPARKKRRDRSHSLSKSPDYLYTSDDDQRPSRYHSSHRRTSSPPTPAPSAVVTIPMHSLDLKDPKDFSLRDLKIYDYEGVDIYFYFHPRIIVDDNKGVFLDGRWSNFIRHVTAPAFRLIKSPEEPSTLLVSTSNSLDAIKTLGDRNLVESKKVGSATKTLRVPFSAAIQLKDVFLL